MQKQLGDLLRGVLRESKRLSRRPLRPASERCEAAYTKGWEEDKGWKGDIRRQQKKRRIERS
jgi:hypothetical protein